MLSYAAAGWVKIVNPDWRNGQALADIFAFSVYPVSEQIRTLAKFPRFMFALSWLIIGFEILFPLLLLHLTSLYVVLAMATLFHLVNAFTFGLNRFLWIWVAGYPCLIWFQQRVFG